MMTFYEFLKRSTKAHGWKWGVLKDGRIRTRDGNPRCPYVALNGDMRNVKSISLSKIFAAADYRTDSELYSKSIRRSLLRACGIKDTARDTKKSKGVKRP